MQKFYPIADVAGELQEVEDGEKEKFPDPPISEEDITAEFDVIGNGEVVDVAMFFLEHLYCDRMLKKHKEVITEIFNPIEEKAKSDALYARKHMDLEFISFSDGKEAVARAANYLFANHYETTIQKEKSKFTEPQTGDALAAVGSGGQEPDLPSLYCTRWCARSIVRVTRG